MDAPNAVVLVEGMSDKCALEKLAGRLGRDFETERVAVVAMGGASALGDFLEELLRHRGFAGRLAGLCDVGEIDDFVRGLERVGLGEHLTRRDIESLGFHVCEVDLEDELIRACGVDKVQRVIAEQGELGSFHRLQSQPQWRDQPTQGQLRRFMGSQSGRKLRYGQLLVEALDLDRAPRPLRGVLDHV